MNPSSEQRDIIDRLYQLVMRSTPPEARQPDCRFDYFIGDDGSRSVGTEFHYIINGERTSARLFRETDRENRPIALVPRLHALMKDHTGGDWHAFRLKVKEDGEVSAKFEYDRAS